MGIVRRLMAKINSRPKTPDIDTDTEEADTEEYEAKTLANFLSSYRDSKNIALDGGLFVTSLQV